MVSEEYLLKPENNRLTVHPILDNEIWNHHQKQEAAFWTAKEIDFSKDYYHFQKLNNNEQHFIKSILAFFAASDTIVNINLAERFTLEVQIREAIIAYQWQIMIENNWLDIDSKKAFSFLQKQDPYLLSMGIKEQRDLVC